MIFRRHLQTSIERYTNWAPPFARLVGCPVVEATHCGRLRCKTPLLPMPYAAELGGGAIICDAQGNVLARRAGSDGPDVVVADLDAGPRHAPAGYRIQELDPVSKLGRHVRGWHGRR